MEGEKKNTVVITAIILAVVLGVWLFGGFSSAPDDGTTEADIPSAPTLSPALQLTSDEKRGDVSERKAEILSRIRSGSSLSIEEKGEIGGIMLTKAHLYAFTDAEREAIFTALQKP